MSTYLKVKENVELGRVNQIDGDNVHLCLPSELSEPPKFGWFARHLLEELAPVVEAVFPKVAPVLDAVVSVAEKILPKVKTPAVKKVAVKTAAPAPKKAAAPAPKKAAAPAPKKAAAPAPKKAATKKATAKK